MPLRFVRVDTVKKPLQPPYDGSYIVLKRESKYFLLDRNGTKDSISIDKPTPKPESAVSTTPFSSTTQSFKDTVSLPLPTTTILS
nr:hypothetical transcript [Hymenolepis microstoma]